MQFLALTLSLIGLAIGSPAVAARPWQLPVPHAVLRDFHFDTDHPFAAGQHRGIDLAAAVGEAVRAACAGEVTFAGSLFAAGLAVSIVCGERLTSYLYLDAITVRRGESVAVGERIGSVGVSKESTLNQSHLHFSVRRQHERWGYIDPLSLVGDLRAADAHALATQGSGTESAVSELGPGPERVPVPVPERVPVPVPERVPAALLSDLPVPERVSVPEQVPERMPVPEWVPERSPAAPAARIPVGSGAIAVEPGEEPTGVMSLPFARAGGRVAVGGDGGDGRLRAWPRWRLSSAPSGGWTLILVGLTLLSVSLYVVVCRWFRLSMRIERSQRRIRTALTVGVK